MNYVFQDIINMKTNEIFGYEALMRPHSKTVSDFLDTYSDDIIEFITFFTSIATFDERYKTNAKYLNKKLFINSLGNVILTKKELEIFKIICKEHINNLVIEITEQNALNTLIHSKKMEFIKENNLLIALDDFGSGNNNLKSIELIKPDIIKIDRSLILNIHNDTSKQKEVNNLIDYIKGSKIELLAEGIELKEELDYIKTLNITYGQGFLFGKPF